MAELNAFFYPRGDLAREGWESVVDAQIPDWNYTGIHVAELAGDAPELAAGDLERIVVPLAGRFVVTHGDSRTQLTGRPSVFDGPTDVLFLGAGQSMTVSGHGRVAVCEATARTSRPDRYVARAEVPVEVRGAGRETRQVHNFGIPGALDADALIVCEVITPAGNWSSYPGHKHDEAVPGSETQLEEIYYFEAAPTRGIAAPPEADAFGSFCTYSSPAGEIEIRAMVRDGDIALVPFGYHGPAAAAPAYDLYYLNIMAGPERGWQFSDDPAQAWIRSTWADQALDPRLPYAPSATQPTPTQPAATSSGASR